MFVVSVILKALSVNICDETITFHSILIVYFSQCWCKLVQLTCYFELIYVSVPAQICGRRRGEDCLSSSSHSEELKSDIF